MKNKLIKNIIMIILIAMIFLSSISNSVFAVTKKVIDNTLEGSISLTVYEFVNGDENNKKELAGAEFTIYSVTTEQKTVADAENYVEKNNITGRTSTTDENGLVTFMDLELGRYFVVETNAPKNVYTKVESFLVDVPSTNEDGTEWNYDIVVYPKNVTVYADVELTKKNTNGDTMEGVVFKLQKENNGKWLDYDLDYELITNANGQIEIHNLEVGKYRLVEIESIEGFIVDSTNTQEFEVSLDNTNIYLNMSNEKVEANKYVLLSNGNYGKDLGVYTKDTVSWKITANIPSIISKMATYTIKDELSDGLNIDKSSIKIYGLKNGNKTLLVSNYYSIDIQNQIMTLNFDNKYLANYEEIEVLYDTTINTNIEYGKATKNEVTMIYTDKISIDGKEESTYTTTPNTSSTAEIHTGELLISKTDGKNALEGAVFKIATSKENAINGTYITDINDNDLVATSDKDGYIVFRGLKYGEDDVSAENGMSYYWIVEVQSPSYIDEDGQTKYYNLLSEPVKVQVNSTSGEYSENTTTVVNKKGFILPKTGAVGAIIFMVIGIVLISVSIIISKKKELNNNEK